MGKKTRKALLWENIEFLICVRTRIYCVQL